MVELFFFFLFFPLKRSIWCSGVWERDMIEVDFGMILRRKFFDWLYTSPLLDTQITKDSIVIGNS